MNRKQKTYIEREFGQVVRIYDNGGKTWDRYTVVFMSLPRERDGSFQARGMSSDPFSGFGMWCSAMPGRQLGKRISPDVLPMLAERLLYQDLQEIKDSEKCTRK